MSKGTVVALRTIAAIGGGIVTLHGVTNRRWKNGHTVFTMLAIVVAAISFSQKK
jgi:hypothetical protein